MSIGVRSSARECRVARNDRHICAPRSGTLSARSGPAGQLQGALNSRVIIEQAKGAVAQIHGCTVDEAFDLLRGYCRSHGLRLGAVAYAVLADPASVPDLTVR
jgi:hypothetical protein